MNNMTSHKTGAPKSLFNNGRGVRPQNTSLQLAISDGLNLNSEHGETSYVYVVGDINARFPDLNLEKEFYQSSLIAGDSQPMFAQVNDRIGLEKLNQNQQLYKHLFQGLSQPQNRYIARDMNWVLDNRYFEELYQLHITDDDLLTQCIAALGRTKGDGQMVLVGKSDYAGVLSVDAIMPVAVMPFGQKVQPEEKNNGNMTELVNKITTLDTSSGNTDALRALNYALYNNPTMYSQSYTICYQSKADGPNPNGYNLTGVAVNTLQSGDRIVADIVFSFQGINSSVLQYWFSRVDVTGEYPFMVVEWQQYLPSDAHP